MFGHSWRSIHSNSIGEINHTVSLPLDMQMAKDSTPDSKRTIDGAEGANDYRELSTLAARCDLASSLPFDGLCLTLICADMLANFPMAAALLNVESLVAILANATRAAAPFGSIPSEQRGQSHSL